MSHQYAEKVMPSKNDILSENILDTRNRLVTFNVETCVLSHQSLCCVCMCRFMYVHMYLCMYICMFICMFVFMYVWVHAHVEVFESI